MSPLLIESTPGKLWTPVHVRARCEKIVASYCDGVAIARYLPLRRRAARYQRRTVETRLPMFPGYLFLHLEYGDVETLLRCNRIAHILRMTAQRESVLIGEMQALQILEAAGEDLELVVAPELVVGTPVEIVAGPLRGMAGIVEKRDKTARVTVNVEMLGQSVSAELDVGEIAVAE